MTNEQGVVLAELLADGHRGIAADLLLDLGLEIISDDWLILPSVSRCHGLAPGEGGRRADGNLPNNLQSGQLVVFGEADGEGSRNGHNFCSGRASGYGRGNGHGRGRGLLTKGSGSGNGNGYINDTTW